MFHVPYPVMASIHAKRAVADTNVRTAARALVAEMRLTSKVREQLRGCEEKASVLVRQKNELIDDNNAVRGENMGLSKKVARLRPWATIGRICIYGGAAAGVFVLVNETTNLIP